jgi:hypothetical protein
MKITLPADIKNEINNLINSKKKQHPHHVLLDKDKTLFYSDGDDKVYIPSPTGKLFHEDDSFVRLVMGPFGSGKSTMCSNEIVRRACKMPVWSAGRRRSRWGIIRNTSGELYTTTLPTWLNWAADLGDIRKRQKPVLTYEHIFNDGNGIVELELLFIAIDRPEDLKRLKSLELTAAFVNELSEVPKEILGFLKSRINGRYPPTQFCKEPYWSGIIADTNAPDENSWIYKQFEESPTESYKIFKQPPGLIKNADGSYSNNNSHDNPYVAPDFYLKIAENQSEDFIKVYCLGQFGIVSTGKIVFPEYNTDFHAVDDIPIISGLDIHLGWDFGLTPACIVCQITPMGQLRVIKEFTTDRMGLRNFVEHVVLPGLAALFPDNKIGESEADPSGTSADQIIEELSAIGELCSLGIPTQPAYSNDLHPRLSSIKYFLNKLIDGKPAFLVSKKGCPMLHLAFAKMYFFKKLMIVNSDTYKEKPEKNSYSHICDAMQYLAMKFASNIIINSKQQVNMVDLWNPVIRLS